MKQKRKEEEENGVAVARGRECTRYIYTMLLLFLNAGTPPALEYSNCHVGLSDCQRNPRLTPGVKGLWV
jgi:hypothetical protein